MIEEQTQHVHEPQLNNCASGSNRFLRWWSGLFWRAISWRGINQYEHTKGDWGTRAKTFKITDFKAPRKFIVNRTFNTEDTKDHFSLKVSRNYPGSAERPSTFSWNPLLRSVMEHLAELFVTRSSLQFRLWLNWILQNQIIEKGLELSG